MSVVNGNMNRHYMRMSFTDKDSVISHKDKYSHDGVEHKGMWCVRIIDNNKMLYISEQHDKIVITRW